MSVTRTMNQQLLLHLPQSAHLIAIEGSEVPEFSTPLRTSENAATVTIAPPIREDGRGEYVSNVCAPMASKKSFRSRAFHWSNSRQITVVLAVRVSYALNAAQEWRESAPNAAEQDAAARERLADFDELNHAQRCAAEAFSPDAVAPASVWCYLTHTNAQLRDLFRRGSGVCIVSPKSCPSFLRAVRNMGTSARIDNLYIEEVRALAQMLFSKVLPDTVSVDALSTLATERSRRVFSFCADWLYDEASHKLMQYLVRDRPQYVFNVTTSPRHMQRNICFFYECGLDETEAAVRGQPAFDSLFNHLLACCLTHRDFSIWMHVNYEKEAVRVYARLVSLGINSLLITGDCDDDDKRRVLTDFDKESKGKQVVISTATVTVGMNFKRNFSACVVVEGMGRRGRSKQHRVPDEPGALRLPSVISSFGS